MQKIITTLNNPKIVSNVQKIFGLVYVKNGEEKSSSKDNKRELYHIQSQNTRICSYYIDNHFFFNLFSFITLIGNEIFYILFLPILTWNYSYTIMYITSISWAINMYLGQAAKDLIKFPRPPSPPVVKLEEKYLNEYGFPSTHAMGGFSISFTLLYFIFQTETNNSLVIIYSCTAFVAIFCVCLSRIYLGMHSLLDIVGGLSFSLFICSIYVKSVSTNLLWLIEDNFVNGLAVAAFFVLICFLYPCKKGLSSARADTFLIMGCAVGLTLGISLKFALNMNAVGLIRSQTDTASSQFYWLCVKRSLVGIVNVVFGRVLSKQLMVAFVKLKYNLKSDATNVEIKEIVASNFKLEMFYYLFCYTVISFSAMFTSFILFEYFQIV